MMDNPDIPAVAVGAVLAALTGVAGWFAHTVIGNKSKAHVLDERTQSQGELAGRVDGLERALADLRLHVAEHYISREDWVPTASRVLGVLEEHTALLARLDERSRNQEERRPS